MINYLLIILTVLELALSFFGVLPMSLDLFIIVNFFLFLLPLQLTTIPNNCILLRHFSILLMVSQLPVYQGRTDCC